MDGTYCFRLTLRVYFNNTEREHYHNLQNFWSQNRRDKKGPRLSTDTGKTPYNLPSEPPKQKRNKRFIVHRSGPVLNNRTKDMKRVRHSRTFRQPSRHYVGEYASSHDPLFMISRWSSVSLYCARHKGMRLFSREGSAVVCFSLYLKQVV